MTTVYDGNPSTGNILSTYTYDALGRPLDVVQVDDGQSIHYGYDDLGRRTSMETRFNNGAGDVVQTNVDYAYDDLNRLQSVTDTLGTPAMTEFDYNPLGQMTTITRPNNVTSGYTYGDLATIVDIPNGYSENPYQVYDINHAHDTNGLISSYEYEYDPVGNRTQMLVTASDLSQITVDYEYDRANRLTLESYNLSNAVISTSYQYDRSGNRSVATNRTNNTVTSESRYHYNDNDELTRIDMPDYMYQLYQYDARGNLSDVSLWSDGAIDVQIGGTTNYDYNAKDQLVSYGSAGVSLVTYDYDYRGNRVTETTGGTPTFYLWDEFSRYGDVILETGDNAGSLYRKVDYVLAAGILVSQTNFNNEVDYFLQDALNSTVALADESGIVAADNTYSYDAFGELQNDPDPNGLGTKYLFTGQYFDALNTELYNLRARQYDPSNGRFLNRDTYAYNYEDPVELNRYVYTANNPMTYVDPSGHNAITITSNINRNVSLLTYAQVLATGIALACTYTRALSYLWSVTKFGAGLVQMEMLNPSPSPCHLPIVLYPFFETPFIGQHILDAQYRLGKPMLLTYIGPRLGPFGWLIKMNRKRACGSFPTLPGFSCDEYPFASTLEGGYNASVRNVPLGPPIDENTKQGQMLSLGYRRNFQYRTLTVFALVVYSYKTTNIP